MDNLLIQLTLLMVFLPLLGAIVAGLLGQALGRVLTHRFVMGCVSVALLLSAYLFKVMVLDHHAAIDTVFYTWATAGMLKFDIGFLLDQLSVTISFIVLFVSFMVHLYTIGYMADDPSYQRFFSYVSLFTFAMLVLVLANNLLLLFFGWEGVGLVSYLLIGFWFKKESAVFGSLKAFLVNRIADIGMILAIAAVLMCFRSLNYHDIFHQVPMWVNKTLLVFPNVHAPLITVICLLFFMGAMGKSAQVPLHVWLPESMEGPTPISALIHAATMVTAGIYLVARLSPLFEFSPITLTAILIIGGTTALFMGILAITQNDIKRVIAYSTLSQLGYMVVALGASAYDVAIFHLITHAFFKALLFLAAGSVILALHHEQDMQKMGGLVRYLPVTYLTFMVGTLALCAIPPFSGFYSKDMIIEAVQMSVLPGATYAYCCVLIGAFITPLYMFRALFLTFHTTERTPVALRSSIRESGWVVWVPLVALAIPSLIAGQLLIGPLIFSQDALLGDSVFVLPEHNVITTLSLHYEGAKLMALRAGRTLSFWFAISGILIAWFFIAYQPRYAVWMKHQFPRLYRILIDKYGFDEFNQWFFVRGAQKIGRAFYTVGDVKMIDGVFVNGSGRGIRWIAETFRLLQTGYLYHYALVMVLGIACCLVWYMRSM